MIEVVMVVNEIHGNVLIRMLSVTYNTHTHTHTHTHTQAELYIDYAYLLFSVHDALSCTL